MPSHSCSTPPDHRLVGDPVDTLTGAVFDRKLEFRLIGPLELRWYRHYDSSQNQKLLALGWGHTHDFERLLRIEGDEMIYFAPVGRRVAFPRLTKDGEEAVRGGLVLRRSSQLRYRIFQYGEPAMEFDFRPSQQETRLNRLFQDKHQILFRYDETQKLQRIIDSCGRNILVNESNDRRLESLTLEGQSGQPKLLLISYHYDQRGNLVATTNASGHGYAFAYDNANRMLMRRGRKGFKFTFVYDPSGRCINATGEDNLYGVTLSYIVPRRVTKVRRADGGEWTYTFDVSGGLESIRDPVGGVQKFVRDETGRVVLELDSNRNATRFLYNSLGVPVIKIDPLRHQIELPEDPNASDPLRHRVAANSAEYEYGRILDVDKISLPTRGEATLLPITPDLRSQVVTKDMPGSIRAEGSEFDVRPLGVLWWPEPTAGRIFNDFGKLVVQRDEFGRQRQWSYDPSGNVADYTDFDGKKWTYDNGRWHLLRATVDPLGATVRFTYTTTGRVASCIDAGGTTSEFRYDLHDHLIEVRRHDSTRDVYVRDAVGNLIGKLARDGREMLRLEIGPGNQPIRRVLASGDEHYFRYDQSGRYLAAITKKDLVAFAYDRFGNTILEKRNDSGVDIEYKGWRKPSLGIYFDRFNVRYSRDQDDAIVIVDPGKKSHTIRISGHGIVERHFGNGSREATQYDNLGRCLFKCAQRIAGPVWKRSYQWSGEGELLRIKDNLRGDVRLEYDAAHRLRRRTFGARIEDYEIDLAGNLLQQPGLGSVNLREGNRLAGANGFAICYNDRNHIESRDTDTGVVRYFYDSRDQLTRVETSKANWTAEYDALNRRTRKTWLGETTEYYWLGDQLIAELKFDGRVRLYIYADLLALTPLLFLDYDKIDAPADSCRRYFVFADQIGSPYLIEDDEGNEVWWASISPYGQAEVAPQSRIEFNLRFPGHYFDREIGLHYNRFRYYDPCLGRYLQSDPWGIAGGYNLYAYRANPLLDVDVRGLGEENRRNGKPCPDEEEPTTPARPATDENGNWVDENGRLRGPNGQFVRDPDAPPDALGRDNQYPSGFRQGTHEAMIRQYTDEGIAQGTGTPVDANGVPIPRDQLTWRDADGNQIPYYTTSPNGTQVTNVTYDHQPRTVEHWNEGGGNNMSRADRADWYNDPNNLTPMSRSDNSSDGAKAGQTYTQETGDDYSN